MAGGNYKVSISVKDGGILQQLENLQKDRVSIGGKVEGGEGGEILRRLENINGNSLLKLAGIGLSLGSLVHLMQKSSGLLQGQLKMLETGFMLILKPIGDFFGLLLRPFVAMFWQVALPFYKWAAPLFQQYGMKIGEFFADPANALAGLATAIGAATAAAFIGKKVFDGIASKLKPDCNCGGSGSGKHSGDCIRLCDMPTPSVPTPTPTIPMPTPMPFPIPSFNPFPQPTGPTPPPGTTIPSSATNHNGFWFGGNKEWWKGIGKKDQQADIIEQMNVAAEGSATSVLGAEQKWGTVESASAAAAVAAGIAAQYWDDAARALGSAVARLQSFVGTIPNSTAMGFDHFGSPTAMAVNNAYRKWTPSTTAAIADTLE